CRFFKVTSASRFLCEPDCAAFLPDVEGGKEKGGPRKARLSRIIENKVRRRQTGDVAGLKSGGRRRLRKWETPAPTAGSGEMQKKFRVGREAELPRLASRSLSAPGPGRRIEKEGDMTHDDPHSKSADPV